MELCDFSALRLAEMLRTREVSATEILRSVFRRIEEREEAVNAYITVARDHALAQADRIDRRLADGESLPPVAGIPLAVKDNLCTRGIRTTCGSRMLENYVPTYDATAVERALAAGAVMIGKANLDEFGMGSSTENSAFGPTRNPLDTAYVPGGSSGGSAAAVAAGEAVFALGTDTGGSIRLPAAFCGLVGIKPTYGRVSRHGVVAYASSLDQVGVLARSVEDGAFLLHTIAGHDVMDSTSAAREKDSMLHGLNNGVKGLKIGLPREYFVEGLDAALRRRIEEAVRRFEVEGAEVLDITLPHTTYATSVYYLIATAEAGSNLARYDGVKYGYRASGNFTDIVSLYNRTRSEAFGPEVKRRILLGTYILSTGYYDAYYLKAQQARALIRQDFDSAFRNVDCILTPVSPTGPFKFGEKTASPLQMYLVDVYTASVNLCGLPAVSLPCGTAAGLPAAFQLIGRRFDEKTLLRAAVAYERLGGGPGGAEHG